MMEDSNIKSPFKFLDSYGKSDRNEFFGRDNEVEETYAKVFQSKILLVYGASGTGKSSIINCGLANKFQETDWLPIHIRRGGNINQSMFNQIYKQAANKVEISEEQQTSKEGIQKVINSVFLDHFKPIYLIFDQFEELFVFGYKDEWDEFISSVRHILDTDLDVHFIFVLRGEYLEFLSEFEASIPEFFDNRVRIEKMTRGAAKGCITGTSQFFSIDLEEGFEEKLIQKLSPEKAHVELTFLQVFLDKIYKMAAHEQKSGNAISFTDSQLERIGHIGDVLAEFVDEQLFRMPDPKAALTVLKSFVSLNGTKTQMSPEKILQYTVDLGNPIDPDQIDQIIKEFVNKRILKDKDDNGHFELRHDSLAEKIYEKITLQEKELLDVRQFLDYSYSEYDKRGLLLNDDDLSYIAPFQNSLQLEKRITEFIKLSWKRSKKRRRQQKIRTIVIAVIVVLMITSILGFFYSQREKSRAESMAQLAQNESSEARKQRKIAEEQRQVAIKNQAEARMQAISAEQAQEIALKSMEEAKLQNSIAQEQKRMAELEKESANVARVQAEESRQEALRQKSAVEVARNSVERLRMLAIAREMAVKSSLIADPQLKALLVLQAYAFNDEFNGEPNQPDIYNGLYLAKKSLSPQNFNVLDGHTNSVTYVHPIKNGLITCGHDGKIIETTWSSGQANSKVLYKSDWVIETMGILDNNQIAAVGTQSGDVILVNLETGHVLFQSRLHTDDVTSITINQEKNTITTISLNGTIKRIDVSGTIIKQSSLGVSIHCAAKMRDKTVIGTSNGELRIVDNELNVIASHLPLKGLAITSLAIQNDSMIVIGYEDGQIVFWDTQSKSIVWQLLGHGSRVSSLNLNESGNLLVTTSYDRSSRIWDMTNIDKQPIVINDTDNWLTCAEFIPETNNLIIGSYSGKQYIYPLNAQDFTKGMCEKVNRNMTLQEWNRFVGEDVIYKLTCNE